MLCCLSLVFRRNRRAIVINNRALLLIGRFIETFDEKHEHMHLYYAYQLKSITSVSDET